MLIRSFCIWCKWNQDIGHWLFNIHKLTLYWGYGLSVVRAVAPQQKLNILKLILAGILKISVIDKLRIEWKVDVLDIENYVGIYLRYFYNLDMAI